MAEPFEPERILLAEERLVIDKHAVPRRRVRVSTHVDETQTWIREDLERETVDVVRVPVDREITTFPQVRIEDDVVIVPVVEEVIVVEKRLVLKEELHLRRRTDVERVEQPITLRKTRAEIESVDLQQDAGRTRQP